MENNTQYSRLTVTKVVFECCWIIEYNTNLRLTVTKVVLNELSNRNI